MEAAAWPAGSSSGRPRIAARDPRGFDGCDTLIEVIDHLAPDLVVGKWTRAKESILLEGSPPAAGRFAAHLLRYETPPRVAAFVVAIDYGYHTLIA